jgi:hypothetical protein
MMDETAYLANDTANEAYRSVGKLLERLEVLEQRCNALSARVQFLEGHVGHSLPTQQRGGAWIDSRDQQQGFNLGPQRGLR